MAGCCEHSNEHVSSINCGKFLGIAKELLASEERLFHVVGWLVN